MEGGRQVSMSKRAGEFVTLRDLISDVGTDVAKYFFLMRRADSPLDFDLELARKQSDENPVYYVQYAHARISSVLRFASEKTADRPRGAADLNRETADLTALSSPEERDLMVHLLFFPYVVEGAALTREPHRMTIYAKELATLFHQFYHAHRIVTEDVRATAARLYLAEATMHGVEEYALASRRERAVEHVERRQGRALGSVDPIRRGQPEQGEEMTPKDQPSNILIVGSVAFDSIETPTGSVDRALGGSAVFASIAASYFTSARVVAVVGEDFGREHFGVAGTPRDRRERDPGGSPADGPSTGGAATTTTCRTAIPSPLS